MKFKLALFFIIVNITYSFAQNIPVYNFKEFESILHEKTEDVYVINFWATWCRPCVKEIPVFNQLKEKYKDQNLKIILVSLDFGNNVQDRINAFAKNQNITAEIIILDDPDGDSWINKVNPIWSGAIPATLIYNRNKRLFYEQSFELNELEVELKKFIND